VQPHTPPRMMWVRCSPSTVEPRDVGKRVAVYDRRAPRAHTEFARTRFNSSALTSNPPLACGTFACDLTVLKTAGRRPFSY
jgi:hypothetical protein